MQAILIRDRAELQPYLDTWRTSELPHPFSAWEFLKESPFAPRFLMVREEGRMLGLAPWFLRQDVKGRTVLGGHPEAWYHDPLIFDESRRPAIEAALIECLRTVPGWDHLSFSFRGEDASLIPHLKKLGWLVEEQVDWQQNAFLDFSDGWERYWQARPHSFVKEMRRYGRLLDQRPHCFLAADPSNLSALLEGLFLLHSAHWPEKDWSSYYAGIRGMATRALARGELYFQALVIEGGVAAADLSVRTGDWGYSLLGAYDPGFSKLAVGHLLYLAILKRMAADGVRRVDMGPGHSFYKQRLQSGNRKSNQVTVASLTSAASLALAGKCFLKNRFFQP